jgi:hypothetical protein
MVVLFLECMGTDQEICEDAVRSGVTLLSPAGSVSLECKPCSAPDCFIEDPFNRDTGVVEESSQKRFGPAWASEELGFVIRVRFSMPISPLLTLSHCSLLLRG